jgi:hypothetical protein
MPLENWIQHYETTRFFHDPQTLIVGIFAVVAACLTIGGTARAAADPVESDGIHESARL